MFGFGKKKRIDSLVETIGSSVTGQTMLMPISADQLIIDAKSDPLIAGYFLGYQLHLIQSSPFPEKDHQGILLDSYYKAHAITTGVFNHLFNFGMLIDTLFKKNLIFIFKRFIPQAPFRKSETISPLRHKDQQSMPISHI